MDLIYLALGSGILRRDCCAGCLFRNAEETLMNALYVIALVVTLAVFAYLVAVLFYPEDFS